MNMRQCYVTLQNCKQYLREDQVLQLVTHNLEDDAIGISDMTMIEFENSRRFKQNAHELDAISRQTSCNAHIKPDHDIERLTSNQFWGWQVQTNW